MVLARAGELSSLLAQRFLGGRSSPGEQAR
jgi:hypothetical protein